MRSPDVLKLYDKVSADYRIWFRYLNILSGKQTTQSGYISIEDIEKTREELRHAKKEVVQNFNDSTINDFEYGKWLRREKKRTTRKVTNFANNVLKAIRRFTINLKPPSNPMPRPHDIPSNSIPLDLNGNEIDDYLNRSGRLSIHSLSTVGVSDEEVATAHDSKMRTIDEPMPPAEIIAKKERELFDFELLVAGDEELLEDIHSPIDAVLISPSKLSEENRRIQQEEVDWEEFVQHALQPEYLLKTVEECVKLVLNLEMETPGISTKYCDDWDRLADQYAPKKFNDEIRQLQYSSEWILVFIEVAEIHANLFRIEAKNSKTPKLYSMGTSQTKENEFLKNCKTRICGPASSARTISVDHDYDTNESRRFAERLVVEGSSSSSSAHVELKKMASFLTG